MKKIFSDKRAIVIFLLPAALVYAIFAIYPVIMSGYYSLLDWNGVGDAKFIGLSNYVKLFVGNNDGFGSALLNSFILAFLSVFVQLTLSLVLALAITYPKVKKQERFYRTVYFLPAIVSTVIIAELWKKIYHPSYGLLNSFLGMLGLESWQREWLGDTETALIAVFIPIVWQYIGNHMLMMYSAIKGVPNELLEAACIDGASYLQTCFLVTIPMIKDMIIVCVTFAIVGSLKVFDLVYVMTNGGPLHATEVPGTLMYSAIFQKNQYGYGSAIAVFIVLECVLFTFAQKNKLNHEVASINRQISEAQSESTRLNSQLDALVSVEMIDQYAVEKLGMSKMQSGQMRYVDVDAYMQARAKAQKTQPSPGAYAHVVRE